MVHKSVSTVAKGSSIKPLGVHDLCHTHSLASLQQSGLSDQQTQLSYTRSIECIVDMQKIVHVRKKYVPDSSRVDDVYAWESLGTRLAH